MQRIMQRTLQRLPDTQVIYFYFAIRLLYACIIILFPSTTYIVMSMGWLVGVSERRM